MQPILPECGLCVPTSSYARKSSSRYWLASSVPVAGHPKSPPPWGLGSAAAWPAVARAQQPAMPVIGVLGAQSADDDYKNFTVPFLQGLKETGYVVGQNVAVEYRYAENQYDRLPALAADLIRRRVAVIVATGTTIAVSAKAATTTLPIVFAGGGDPVALGLVASLNRPGANVTGIDNLGAELSSKQLQLLHELLSSAALFGVLEESANQATQYGLTDLQAAAIWSRPWA